MNIEKQLEKIADICRKRNIRFTPSRREVMGLILQSPHSVKAYDLLKRMVEIHPNTKPPIVYRALEFLEEQGFIHRIESLNAWAVCQHMEHESCHDHHLLLACMKCGRVKEVHHHELNRDLVEFMKANGFRPAQHETEIQAICDKCR